jgi:cysteinyl-tRNA synthetase
MLLFNTLTRKKETFEPLEPGVIRFYGCGPTVFNRIHIGNARAFVTFDVLRRYLIFKGYTVKFVQNFTDVDDKIIRKANEERVTFSEISEKYIDEYFTDAKGLNILAADVHPKATETIPGIIALVQRLIDNGSAYAAGGDVYFRVRSFPSYGKLSNQPLEALEDGARIEVGEIKESPADFTLWKAAKPGEPSWQSPWGRGRPGWHIECSAMCLEHLGETIDIHGGGSDLVFPHHENEIAQSEAATGKPYVRFWIHNAFITIDNHKMGKSLNNFFNVRDAAEKYGYEAIRYFLLSAHYRSPLNYTADSLEQSVSALKRLHNTRDNLLFIAENALRDELSPDEQALLVSYAAYHEQFLTAMDDDLNTADALAAIFDMSRALNSAAAKNPGREFAREALASFSDLLNALGLFSEQVTMNSEQSEDERIAGLIEKRSAARAAKDFKESDRIRDELKALGITLEDTPLGVKWRKD